MKNEEITTPTTDDKVFPTKWHPASILEEYVECRQTSEDTYQLKDGRYITTMPADAFNLWRADTKSYIDWLKFNKDKVVTMIQEDYYKLNKE